jgi:hypothetical protein
MRSVPALDGREGSRSAFFDDEGDDGVALVQWGIGVAEKKQGSVVPHALRPRPRLAATAAVVQERRAVGGRAHAVGAGDVASRKGGAGANVEDQRRRLACARAEHGAEQVGGARATQAQLVACRHAPGKRACFTPPRHRRAFGRQAGPQSAPRRLRGACRRCPRSRRVARARACACLPALSAPLALTCAPALYAATCADKARAQAGCACGVAMHAAQPSLCLDPL